MNEAMRSAGLAAARQVKTGDWSEVREFLQTLDPSSPPTTSTTTTTTKRSNSKAYDDGGACSSSAEEISSTADEEQISDIFSIEEHRQVEAKAGDGQEGAKSSIFLDEVKCVVKPARGCASGNVFLCNGEREAKEAFEKILGTPKYGTPGAVNDQVRDYSFFFLSFYKIRRYLDWTGLDLKKYRMHVFSTAFFSSYFFFTAFYFLLLECRRLNF